MQYDLSSILNKFGYHKPDGETAQHHRDLRNMMITNAIALNLLPKCDERDKAIDALRESMMWANAAIAITSSPPVLDELDDDTVEMIHHMIVGADEFPPREVMLRDIETWMTPALEMPPRNSHQL